MYEASFLKHVLELPKVSLSEVLSRGGNQPREVQLPYSSKKDFGVIAKKLSIMVDFRVSFLCYTSPSYPHQPPSPPPPHTHRVEFPEQATRVWSV